MLGGGRGLGTHQQKQYVKGGKAGEAHGKGKPYGKGDKGGRGKGDKGGGGSSSQPFVPGTGSQQATPTGWTEKTTMLSADKFKSLNPSSHRSPIWASGLYISIYSSLIKHIWLLEVGQVSPARPE